MEHLAPAVTMCVQVEGNVVWQLPRWSRTSTSCILSFFVGQYILTPYLICRAKQGTVLCDVLHYLSLGAMSLHFSPISTAVCRRSFSANCGNPISVCKRRLSKHQCNRKCNIKICNYLDSGVTLDTILP